MIPANAHRGSLSVHAGGRGTGEHCLTPTTNLKQPVVVVDGHLHIPKYFFFYRPLPLPERGWTQHYGGGEGFFCWVAARKWERIQAGDPCLSRNGAAFQFQVATSVCWLLAADGGLGASVDSHQSLFPAVVALKPSPPLQ